MTNRKPHAPTLPRKTPGDPTSRPLPFAALGLAVGITLADLLDLAAGVTAARDLVAATLVIGASALVLVWCRGASRRNLFVLASFVLCGSARVVSLPPLVEPASGYARFCGRVVRGYLDLPPSMAAAGPTFLILDDVAIDTGGGARPLAGRLRLEAKALFEFVPRGTWVECTARLRAPRPARNPGDPGEARRFALDGIVVAAVVEHDSALSLESGRGFVDRLLAANDRLRRALVFGLSEALEPSSASLAAALVLGVREGLDRGFVAEVAAAGTIHLLAISGMQVAWLVVWVRGLLGLWLRPSATNCGVVIFALAYADLAGAEAPVLRAGVAAALVGIGRFLGRPAQALDALAAAAIVLLVASPAELFRPGFQLSFVACHALVTRAPMERARGAVWRKSFALVKESLRMSLRATLFTAPIVAAFFGTIAPLSPLLTLALTPPFLAAFIASVLIAPVSLVISGASLEVVAAPCEMALRFAAWAFRVTASLPLASHHVLPPHPATALALLVALEVVRRADVRRWIRIRTVVATLLACGLFESVRCAPPRQTSLVVLDVGHGQAVIVRDTSGVALLVDCGAAGGNARLDGERAARTVWRACSALGIRRFDLAIVSHGDSDHVNGLPNLLEYGLVRSLAVPHRFDSPAALRLKRVAAERGIAVREVSRGDSLVDLPNLRVLVLAPEPSSRHATENDASLVVLVDAHPAAAADRPLVSPRTRILLPGDLETPGIVALLQLEPALSVDVTLLPHHGRDEPGLAPFVHHLRAPLWIASRGPLPGASLAGLLAIRHFADLRVTATDGAVVVTIRSEGPPIAESFLAR